MRNIIWTLAAFSLIAANFALAQETRATISGRVTDPSGAGLADAPVRIVNTNTRTEFTARTNNDGLFTVPYLLPGSYDLTVEKSGFKKMERNNVVLQVNDNLSLDLQMVLGDVSQNVVVSGEAPLLQTSDPGLGQVVEEKQMAELPNPSGNSVEFQLLAPGMVNSGGIAIHEAAFNNNTTNIMANGNTSRSNEYAIDGIPNMMADGVTPRVAFSAPQGAIAEVKVITTFYDSAMGHTPGAVINMITLSGTNLFHGDLHEYVGGSFFNANDFFANSAGQKRPVYRDNRFGGSFNGPLWIPRLYNGRNKTFFSYVYEPHKWNVPEQYTNTIPTNAERSGDLSALLKLGAQYQIYNPFSTTTTGNGIYTRQPVPGNIIPASLINPIAANIAKYWPQPNTAGRVDGSNNLVEYTASNEDYFVDFLRVDHYFSERNRTFIRLDYDYWEEHKADNQEYNNISTGLVLHRINRGLAIDHVFVVSASSVLDLRYGITQQDFPEYRRSKGFDLSTLGFSPSLTSLIGNPALATFPYVTLSSFSGFGNWETGDGTNTSLLHDWNATLSMLKGAHSIKYGADFRLNRNFQNRYPYDISPALSFGTTYTQGINTGFGSAIGEDLASFLFGVPTGGSMQHTASFADQDLFFAAFVQDDWKVTPKLTL
ncbi:MAG TPA: carboxypeptidase-like regulatory domain-containing protein, partial [Bryobacteraceae bacterium]